MVMQAVSEDRPPSPSGGAADRGYLAWKNIAYQTGAHLLAEGQRLPVDTRIVLARIRDLAEAMGEEARSQLAADQPPRPASPQPRRGWMRRAGQAGLMLMSLMAFVLASLQSVRPWLDGQLEAGGRAGTSGKPTFASVAAPVPPRLASLSLRTPGEIPLGAPQFATVVYWVPRTGTKADLPPAPPPEKAPKIAAPLAGPAGSALAQASVIENPLYAVSAEEELRLRRAERRMLQRRLALAGHDPKFYDGIFGARTRDAIANWQRSRGETPTGYFNSDSVTALTAETRREYAALLRREEQLRRAARAPGPPTPVADVEPESCARDASGRIAYRQSFACDLAALGEKIIGVPRAARAHLPVGTTGH
ncbi:MAG TPA: peptidoglycan-binding domain-containing protein [Paracoccaceae bacterium]|nr:peptidoglycan-binding domain-containing protein [Paracoccaceae bacterium]